MQQPLTETADEQELKQFVIAFQDAMDDDFNTANGITVVFDMAKWINSGSYTEPVKSAFEKMLAVLVLSLKKRCLRLTLKP